MRGLANIAAGALHAQIVAPNPPGKSELIAQHPPHPK